MRVEATISPSSGMHEWVASFSLLKEPVIDMEVSAMKMPFDAMVLHSCPADALNTKSSKQSYSLASRITSSLL